MKAQKILTLSTTVFITVVLAVLYFWQIGRGFDEAEPEEIPSGTVGLLNRDESEVVEVVFYRGGEQMNERMYERTYARPFTDRFGMLQWSYSAATGFDLRVHMVRDKVRPTWILTASDTAHENAADLDLADFGLAPPALTAEAIFYDDTRNRIHLGSRTADLQFYFAMVEGDPAIYLINAVLGERLLYTVGDMIDLSLPAMDISEAEYIRIAVRGAEPIVLGLAGADFPPSPLAGIMEEVGGEHLIMYAPIYGIPLSHSRFLERIFDPMESLRLREVAALVPDDLADFGLDDPALEFILRTPDRETHLKFGDTFSRGVADFIYVMEASRPHVFIADAANPATVIATEPMQIVDRALALVSIADIERVTVRMTDRVTDHMTDRVAVSEYELIFNHIPDTSEIAPTLNGYPIDPDDARHAFRLIIGLIADADIEPFIPTSEPYRTITHHHIDGTTTELRFFDYNANFLAVSINGGEAVFVTSRLAVDRILNLGIFLP
ncbi:MAG: DUF4340 domain-containing protein [Defluviitaleaceae bacterium]|nr:DUF4340 domain-containing protein [Defluviitaleaceae bacterium]